MRAREDRDPDRVRVLLERGLDDLLRRLVEARVDDLHPGVAQRARDDLRTPVVAVQAGFRDDDTDLPGHGWLKYMEVRLRVIGSSPAWPNPGSAQSGYLVEGAGTLLLDCGPGVLARLREEGELEVDAIAITHFHLDHWGDLVPWAWLVAYGDGTARHAELWLPPGGAGAARARSRRSGGTRGCSRRHSSCASSRPGRPVRRRRGSRSRRAACRTTSSRRTASGSREPDGRAARVLGRRRPRARRCTTLADGRRPLPLRGDARRAGTPRASRAGTLGRSEAVAARGRADPAHAPPGRAARAGRTAASRATGSSCRSSRRAARRGRRSPRWRGRGCRREALRARGSRPR